MRVVVTGAAGFIGFHLCEQLLIRGDEVVGIDCLNDADDPSRKSANVVRLRAWPSFELIRADLAAGVNDTWLRDCDVVYHLAGECGQRPSWGTRFPRCVDNNIVATWRLLDVVRGMRLRKFVYASCASVYGAGARRHTPETAPLRPLSPFAVSKLAAEGLCETYRRTCDVPTLALRLFAVYGTGQRPDQVLARLLTAALSRQPFLLYGDGHQTRDLVHVSDVVSAMRVSALSPRTGVMNVGTGSAVSVLDLVHAIGELVRPVDLVRLPPEPGAVRHCTADISLARTWFDYRPRVSLVDGLTELVGAVGPDGCAPPPVGVAALHPVTDAASPHGS